MVARSTKKKMTRRKPDVNFACRKIGILSAGVLAGLWLGLAAGCSTPSSSQKVYDRYAELVASRNQPAKSAPNGAPPVESLTVERTVLDQTGIQILVRAGGSVLRAA